MPNDRPVDPQQTTDIPTPPKPETIDVTGAYQPSPDTEPNVKREASPWPTIDGYTITGEIARGGMGCVLAAREERLERDVAIKILLPHANADQFIREAKATAQLPHPNIPPVYALGLLEDHSPYLAMKRIGGQTLATMLAARANPHENLSRFLAVFEQIAQAVGFAHARGFIHRDLKPANVMVGDFGEVLVMDWGLAEHWETTPTDEPRSVCGTPAYMAPEQARAELLDPRTDVFALGGILTTILTGQAIFVGSNLVETLDRAARGDTSEVRERLANCGADSELIRLAQQCLEADREPRPKDGQEVADRVADYRRRVDERAKQAEQERAAAVAREQEQRKRKRVVQWASSAIAIVLLLGASMSAWQAWRANQAKNVANQKASDEEIARRDAETAMVAEANAKEQAIREKRVAENTRLFFVKVLSRSSTINFEGTSNPRITVKEAIELALTLLHKDFANDPEGEADIRVALAGILASQGDHQKAQEQVQRARELYKKLFGEQLPQYPNMALTAAAVSTGVSSGGAAEFESAIELLRNESAKPGDQQQLLQIQVDFVAGTFAIQSQKYQDAMEKLQRALAKSQAKYGDDHLLPLMIKVTMATCLRQNNQAAQGEQMVKDVLAIANKKFSDSFIVMSCLSVLGTMELDKPQSDLDLANKYLQQALKLAEKINMHESPNAMSIHINLAQYYVKINNHTLAHEHIVKAESLFQRSAIKPPEFYRLILINKASQLMALRRYVEAQQAYEKLEAEWDNPLYRADRNTILFGLCKSRLMNRKFAEAEVIANKYIAHCEQSTSKNFRQLAVAYTLHMRTMAGLNRSAEFRADLQRINGLVPSMSDDDQRFICSDLQGIGKEYQHDKQHAVAVAIFTEVHRWRREKLTINHNDTAVSAGDLAHALSDLGKHEGREQLYREALDGTKAAMGAAHENTRLCANNLVWYYDSSGQKIKSVDVLVTLYRWVAEEKGSASAIAQARAWAAVDLCQLHECYAEAIPIVRDLVAANKVVVGEGERSPASALLTLGQYLLLTKQYQEAIEPLRQALAMGQPKHTGPITYMINHVWLAEALLGTKKYDEAERLFLVAYPALRDEPKTYLRTSVTNITDGLVRLYTATNKQDEAKKWQQTHDRLVAATALNAAIDAGHVDSLPRFVAILTEKPDDTHLMMKVTTLQVWHGKTADWATTCQQSLKHAYGTKDFAVAERTAKSCCLAPLADKEPRQAALQLARMAAEQGKDHPHRHYYWLALGMAEYRSGSYVAAEQSFTKAGFTDPVYSGLQQTAAMYRALCLFQLKKIDEATKIANGAIAQMKPLPKDHARPLADGHSIDDLILFLAYKEAAAVLKLDTPMNVPLAPKMPTKKK